MQTGKATESCDDIKAFFFEFDHDQKVLIAVRETKYYEFM